MADKDYSPLSTSCVRALNDKLYEKRKVAALEIERMVKEFVNLNNTGQIQRMLRVLGQDFTLSQNPNSRKGGLIGLAATAIALGKDSSAYVHELVRPVLTCFFDADSRVRYYGCEALYNIVKVSRGSVLPFFNEIFDGLSKLASDPDQNVRSGCELLDRLMKDIVTESCQFDLAAFMPLLRERIYTKNPFARQFIVSWVGTLDAVPDIDMLVLMPEILDGMFHILGDSNQEIRKMCEATLGEFLTGVNRNPQKVNYSAMANILITHSQSPDGLIQFTSVMWLKEFVQLSGRTMLPYTSGILTAILPGLSYDDNDRKSILNIREASKAVNNNLMKLVSPEDDLESPPQPQIPPSQPGLKDGKKLQEDSSVESKESESTELSSESSQTTKPPSPQRTIEKLQLNLPSLVDVLTRHLVHDSMQTRIATLRWIYQLFLKTPNKMFKHTEELFPLLLKTLSDPSDEVVLLDLEVLAEISSSQAGKKYSPDEIVKSMMSSGVRQAIESSHGMNGYFTKFMLSLLQLFSTDRQLLDDRGSFIVRQLCLLLNAEDIYRCCSEILLHEEDMKFASHMIQTLSTILLTSTELFELRTQLKDLKTDESCSLFSCLYKSWCHNPVSTVALCFLTQNYRHACDLLAIFGDLEVTVDFLTEIDKLIQLIESPIFTYLRLQLLDVEMNHDLVKSLYGLLMLLPQSDAFQTLQRRLQCIPSIQFLPPHIRPGSQTAPNERPCLKRIDFVELVVHFRTVQEKHRASRRVPRSLESLDKPYL